MHCPRVMEVKVEEEEEEEEEETTVRTGLRKC